MATRWRWAGFLVMTGACWLGQAIPAVPQSEQVVEVTVKNFTFITKQGSLRLGLPTVIRVSNQDAERHDFGSTMFQGIPTKIERDGMIVYGRGLEGVMLDSKREATIRFGLERPGSYTFRCSIHPNMKGELLLLNVEAA